MRGLTPHRSLSAGRLRVLAIAISVALPTVAHADSRTDARRYFTRGMEAIGSGAYSAGIDLLLRAYELRPHANVLYNVGRAYVKLGDLDRAHDYFERYLDSQPADAGEVKRAIADIEARRRLRALVDEGMAAIQAGRHHEGVALLQRAYEQRPHANLLFNIARAQEQAQDTNGAIANYEAYLASKPRDFDEVQRRLERLRAQNVARRTDPKKPEPTPTKPDRGDPIDARGMAELVVSLLREQGLLAGSAASPSPRAEPLVLSSTAAASDVQLEDKAGAGYEEVVVTASRREQSPVDAPNAVTIITEEDIRLSGARSIPDLLRRVPGMDVMQMSYTDWNVTLRGFNRRIANKLLILVDGRTAYEDFLGGMLWSAQSYDLLDIARIEVVRGPGSAIYGANAFAGIVNIITKRPEEIDGSTAQVGGGNGAVVRTMYQYGKRKGPLGVRASVGYEQGNKFDFEIDPSRVDYTAAKAESAASIDRSLEIFRADAQADYRFEENAGRVYLGAGIMEGVTEFYGVSALRNQNNDATGSNVRAGFSGELFSILAFWNRLRTDTKPQFFRTGLPDLGSRVEADLVVLEPVVRPTFSLMGEHQLVVGGEYRHKFIDWTYLDGEHEEVFFALFAQDSWSISKSWTVIASYRLDHHPLIGLIEQPDLGLPGSPRLAVVYKPAPGQAIRASVGTAFRQPTQAETYLKLAASSPVAGVAIELVGDESLLPEDIITLEVGYLYQGDLGEIDAVGFLNRVNNLIVRTPLIPTGVANTFNPDVGAFVGLKSVSVNEDRVFIAAGSEVSTRLYPVEGLDLGLSYAFQYIFDADTGERFTDSPLHKASLWSQFRTRFGVDAGLSIHFVSDQDWIEEEFDPDDPSGFRVEPQRVDANVVIVGRVAYRLLDDQLELAVAGTNLVDVANSRHLEHPFGNRLEARVVGSVTARF